MEEGKKEFKASLDFIATYLGWGILISVIIFSGILITGGISDWKAFIPLVIVSLGILSRYFYSPQLYSVGNNRIEIIRTAGKYVIVKEEIHSIQSITKKEMGTVWRLFGNGGLYGYTGWFSTSIGKMRWFVTQRKNYVLIQMKDYKKFLLSPDDVEGFLAAVA